MARQRKVFVCIECGSQQGRWLGRCPDCGAWDSIKEEKMPAPGGGSGWSVGGLGGEGAVAIPGEAAVAIPIGEVEPRAERRLATGIGELDRVLGGGLVPGCGVLLAGEPGIGKSTLLLQAAQSLSLAGERFLYVSGEESAAQVKLRADRLGESGEELYLLAECELERIEEQIVKLRPAALGVDSVQAVRWHQLPSSAGSVLQVREVAARLITLGRRAGFPLLLVGHVTKEGTVAGPRVLEHMVDGVLSFEGERTHGLRVLRARKNRFGSTQEVGLFDMRAGGLFEVENPSHLLLGERRGDAPGSATAAILEGSRPLLVEVQSLVSPTAYGSPARRVSGIDPGRLSMLSAVLEKRLGLPLGDKDIYANVVGGVRVQNTAADLALAAALISSLADRPIPAERVFTGEVGLLGEVRPVPGLSHRMEEAARLGFTSAWIPEGSLPEAPPAGLALRELRDLGDLLRCLEE